MPLAYQQTWQNGSAREAERQRQHRLQRLLRQQQQQQQRRPQQLRRQLPQRLRQQHHRELALRRRRGLGQHHRHAHNAVAASLPAAPKLREGGCEAQATIVSAVDASHRDAATAAFYLTARPALRCDRRVRSLSSRITQISKSTLAFQPPSVCSTEKS